VLKCTEMKHVHLYNMIFEDPVMTVLIMYMMVKIGDTNED